MTILAWMKEKVNTPVLNTPDYECQAAQSWLLTYKVNDPKRQLDLLQATKDRILWVACEGCGENLFIRFLRENGNICEKCLYHNRMRSDDRIELFVKPGTWAPLYESLSAKDPLNFIDEKSYTQRLKAFQEKTGIQDAVQTGVGLICDVPFAVAVMDFRFIGGSMGSVVGEKITRLIEYATAQGLYLLIVSASGGARMQEGIYSLMQMAKISAALHIYQNQANLFYVSVCSSPTTGGVTASFAMLGDIIFSEPNTVIGFAGRRVIQQILLQELPESFQTSESLLSHGLLDSVIPRWYMRKALSEVINFTAYGPSKYRQLGHISVFSEQLTSDYMEEKIRRICLNTLETSHDDMRDNYNDVVYSGSAFQTEDINANVEFISENLETTTDKESDFLSEFNDLVHDIAVSLGLPSLLTDPKPLTNPDNFKMDVNFNPFIPTLIDEYKTDDVSFLHKFKDSIEINENIETNTDDYKNIENKYGFQNDDYSFKLKNDFNNYSAFGFMTEKIGTPEKDYYYPIKTQNFVESPDIVDGVEYLKEHFQVDRRADNLYGTITRFYDINNIIVANYEDKDWDRKAIYEYEDDEYYTNYYNTYLAPKNLRNLENIDSSTASIKSTENSLIIDNNKIEANTHKESHFNPEYNSENIINLNTNISVEGIKGEEYIENGNLEINNKGDNEIRTYKDSKEKFYTNDTDELGSKNGTIILFEQGADDIDIHEQSTKLLPKKLEDIAQKTLPLVNSSIKKRKFRKSPIDFELNFFDVTEAAFPRKKFVEEEYFTRNLDVDDLTFAVADYAKYLKTAVKEHHEDMAEIQAIKEAEAAAKLEAAKEAVTELEQNLEAKSE